MQHMDSLKLNTHWTLGQTDTHELLPRALRILQAVELRGSLSAACDQMQISYRHAWGVLHDAEQLFGQPLMHMERGKGTLLTPLGQKLLWADRKAQARLQPDLQAVASQMLREVHTLLNPQQVNLRMDSGHCFAVAALHQQLLSQNLCVEINYSGTRSALDLLTHGHLDLAAFQWPTTWPQPIVYQSLLMNPNLALYCLAKRTQGLMFKANNPMGIRDLRDLTRKDLRFVQGQVGSYNTKMLNTLLRAQGIDPTDIPHPLPPENNHRAIAAVVASGEADVGFGLQAAAAEYNLDFLPTQEEWMVLGLRTSAAMQACQDEVLQTLQSAALRLQLDRLAGYCTQHTGQRIQAVLEHQTSPVGVQ